MNPALTSLTFWLDCLSFFHSPSLLFSTYMSVRQQGKSNGIPVLTAVTANIRDVEFRVRDVEGGSTDEPGTVAGFILMVSPK